MNGTSARTRYRDVARRQAKRLFVWLLAALLVVLTLSLLFLTTPYVGPDASVERLDADGNVSLQAVDGGYVIEPAETETEAGLVFYPGARVAPSAYLDVVAPLAREANVTVVVPRMPLNLAIIDYGVARTPLATDAATEAMATKPEIERWYVGGHSLGGAMACRYANAESNRVDGLVLFGSYCDRDISDSGLSVVSVVGRDDTVMDWSRYQRGLDRLPSDTTTAELDGLNHSHFGSYSGQLGDAPTGTSYETAHRRINEVVVPWFRDETGEPE